MARSTGQIGKAVEGDQAVGSAAVWHLTIPKHGMGHVFDGIGDGQLGIWVSTNGFFCPNSWAAAMMALASV